MAKLDLSEIVVRAIATELKRDEDSVRSAQSLKRELEMDSIAAVNIAFALEDELGIEITLDEGESFDSVSAIVGIVQQALRGS